MKLYPGIPTRGIRRTPKKENPGFSQRWFSEISGSIRRGESAKLQAGKPVVIPCGDGQRLHSDVRRASREVIPSPVVGIIRNSCRGGRIDFLSIRLRVGGYRSDRRFSHPFHDG
jgi:hypothetical protein